MLLRILSRVIVSIPDVETLHSTVWVHWTPFNCHERKGFRVQGLGYGALHKNPGQGSILKPM